MVSCYINVPYLFIFTYTKLYYKMRLKKFIKKNGSILKGSVYINNFTSKLIVKLQELELFDSFI